jgi:3-isopropylmalate dehydratase small subunit
VRRQCLLEGLDDVDRTRQYQGAIEAFEAEYKGVRRWLY